MNGITITSESIRTPDAIRLLCALSSELESITGNSGVDSFDANEMDDPRACFAIARDENGAAIGCGAIRPLDMQAAEMKRVYAHKKHAGVGKEVLNFLESKAVELGFHRIVLETRVVNVQAVEFYLKNGYAIIQNYGKYVKRVDAICFEKRLGFSV